MSQPRHAVENSRNDAGPFWRRRATHIAIGVLVVYAVIACVIFWPTGPLDSTRLPEGVLGDPDEMTWFLAWTPWALTHGHNLLLSNAIDLPQGVNLANNTSVPLLGVLATPFTLTLGPIAAFNLFLRVALAASAGTTYFVFRRWCTGTTGPFLGGLLFGFSPALLSHLHTAGHLDLIFVPFLAVMVALIDELVVCQRRSPIPVGVLLGLTGAAQYLVSAELFADAVLLGVISVLWLGARHHELVGSHWRHLAIGLGAALVCFFVIAGYPIYLALVGPHHLSGPVQAVSHLQRFRTDLAEIVLPDPRQLLAPARLARISMQTLDPVRLAGGAGELGGYLGVPLLIVTGALAVRFWRVRGIGVAALIALLSLIASLGSRLQVAGHSTGIPLPEVVLAKLPLFDNIVPARFSIFAALFVTMALAIGLDRFIHTGRPSTPTRIVAIGLVIVGVGASLTTFVPRIPVSSETTALPAKLAQAVHDLVPPGAVVLAYPYPQPPYAQAMLWQASDNFRFTLLGGYANIEAPTGKGQIFPLVSRPEYVQEFLGAAESGDRGHYPRPAPTANSRAQLCSFILENHVTTVVYQAYGPGAGAVRSWLVSALSKPTSQAAGLSVWAERATSRCNSGATGATS